MKQALKNTRLKFDVYGTQMIVERQNEQWLLFNVSNHGMLTRNRDVAIPADLVDSELIAYLDDLFHESATLENTEIKPLD